MARDRNITTFSSLEVVPSPDNPNNPDNGFYFPRLTTNQRDLIDVVSDSRGCTIFNTTTKQLETLSENSTWGVLGGGGGGGTGDFENVNVTDKTTTANLEVTADSNLNNVNVTGEATFDTIGVDTVNVAYVAASAISSNLVTTNVMEVGGELVTTSSQIGARDAPTRLVGTSQPNGIPYLNPGFKEASDPGTNLEMRGSNLAGEIRLTTPATVASSAGLYLQFDISPNSTDDGLIAFTLSPSSAAAAQFYEYFYVETTPGTGITGTGSIVKIFKRSTTLLANTQYNFFYHMIGNKQLT